MKGSKIRNVNLFVRRYGAEHDLDEIALLEHAICNSADYLVSSQHNKVVVASRRYNCKGIEYLSNTSRTMYSLGMRGS